MTPRPFLLRPKLVPKVWGGANLIDLWNKSSADAFNDPLGESWEVADLPEGQSVIASGALEGEPLREAVTRWGADLLGDEGEQFPLLVKLLDAARDLSVQVHPGPDHVGVIPGARSKDESWMILRVDEGGAILHGLRQGVTRERFVEHLSEGGDPTSLMRREPVFPGDIIRVPPGTLHAICAGVSLLEIQQPSDTTYRVWDYNRPGMDGNLRELHIEQALRVINFGPQPPIKLASSVLSHAPFRERLVTCDAYEIERVTLTDEHTIELDRKRPYVLHLLTGSIILPEDNLTMGIGDTLVVPACCDYINARSRGLSALILTS